LNTDALSTVGKVIERFGIYIAVGLFVFFAFNGWQSMARRADLQERQNIMLEQKMEAWNQYIGELVKQQKEIVGKIGEKKVEQQFIKFDVGKQIKSFNKKVKAIKQTTDPKESIQRLMDAWDRK
jgi:hypothetical protein